MRGGSRVTVGYDLTVTCDTGRSNPRVSRVVISSGGVVLASTDGSSTSITITNPTLENNGTVYVCTAVNAIGNTSRNFSLIVQGEWLEHVCLPTCLPVCLQVCVSLSVYLLPILRSSCHGGHHHTDLHSAQPAGSHCVVDSSS